jgi:hypothetical protein
MDIKKFKHVEKFIRDKAHGLDLDRRCFDNFTGTKFESFSGIKTGLGSMDVYDIPNNTTTTGPLGTYANSEEVGEYLAKPKYVVDGRYGITRPITPYRKVNLEDSK